MKKLFFVFLFATMITGCGGSEKTTTVCKGNIDELTTNTTTIESSDDQVEIMRAEVVYDVTGYVTDTFPIPIDFVGNSESFMLTVRGESMIEARNIRWRLYISKKTINGK